MDKKEFMGHLFSNYNYKIDENSFTVGNSEIINIKFSKDYTMYKHCTIEATYLNGEVTVKYVTNGGSFPIENSDYIEAIFKETKECEEILKALKENNII